MDEKFEPVHRPKEFDLSRWIPQSEDTGIRQPMENAFKRKTKKKKISENNITEQAIEEDAGETDN